MAHGLHSGGVVTDNSSRFKHFRKWRRPVSCHGSRASRRAFTLVELAVVVVIVGILAMLAVVAYRKLIGSSRTAEATHMVQAIRVAQEAYHAETQQYANVSTSLTGTYPSTSPGRFKTGWGAACTNCNSPPVWTDLPVHVDGPVEFGYATVAGAAGNAPSPTSVTINGTSVSFPAKSPTDFFIIHAFGDTEGAGVAPTLNGPGAHVFGTSWTNDLFVEEQ